MLTPARDDRAAAEVCPAEWPRRRLSGTGDTGARLRSVEGDRTY